MAKDPNAVAAKWATNLANSTTSMAAGIDAVTVAPGAAAARQKDVWAAQVAASKDKWAKNTAAVPLSDWQSAMKDKGIPRIASGANAAVPKQVQFYQKFLPFVDSAVASLPPRGNLQQNIARATQLMTKLATYQN